MFLVCFVFDAGKTRIIRRLFGETIAISEIFQNAQNMYALETNVSIYQTLVVHKNQSKCFRLKQQGTMPIMVIFIEVKSQTVSSYQRNIRNPNPSSFEIV